MKVVQESLDDLLAHYKAHPQDAQKLLDVSANRGPMPLWMGRRWRRGRCWPMS